MIADPSKGGEFANMLIAENQPIGDLSQIVDVFMESNNLRGCTAFLLDALKGDRDEDAALQTRLL
eukprot:Awhi_evm1s6917